MNDNQSAQGHRVTVAIGHDADNPDDKYIGVSVRGSLEDKIQLGPFTADEVDDEFRRVCELVDAAVRDACPGDQITHSGPAADILKDKG